MANVLPIPPPSVLLSLRESCQDILGGRKKLQPPSVDPKERARGGNQGPGEQVTITGAEEQLERMVPQSPWEGRTPAASLCTGARSAQWGLVLPDSGVLKVQVLS